MWNEEQRKVIESNSNYKQVIAAAGSGKTATMIGILQHKEERKTISPERTLIVTFTKKATEEFKTRVEAKHLSEHYHISTFHSFCYQSLFELHPEFHKISLLSETEKEQQTKRILYKHRMRLGGIPFAILFSSNYSILRKEFPDVFEDFLFEMETYKRKNNLFEFEDLIRIVKQSLETGERWTFPLKQRFDSLIIDEFQDTNLCQMKIIQMLQIPQITVVGDDWQAIYGFRGATPEPFLNFSRFFPKTEIFQLTTNYRSLKGIIELSSIPIRKNKNKIEKKVFSHREGNTFYRTLTLKHPKRDLKSAVYELKTYFESDRETMILVRSNFRKREWMDAGIRSEQIMTIHASKGLEFGTVILDLSSGWNLTGEGKEIPEEERRILYVGISRAKDKLILIGRETSKFKERPEDKLFSYFPKTDSWGKLTLRSYRFW
ncbi:UvrD-helicase domain-containing protein [Leptospira idonii]|uniref:DNA 3'-5' helicase n=1 Tax=Leptospira idonii TaxID=1193500 RepID=A0A4R9LXE3_9LEPT|nr:UvrD-helicase domain-containing protein [Leptospira idonii]TGN17689.1 DNA helicase [Leptospira idonii]